MAMNPYESIAQSKKYQTGGMVAGNDLVNKMTVLSPKMPVQTPYFVNTP